MKTNNLKELSDKLKFQIIKIADPTFTTFFGYPNAYRSYGITINYMF